MRLQMNTKNFDKKRWICLIGAMLIVSTCAWKQLWSITFNPLIDDYGFTAGKLAGVYSTYALLATVLMLIAGKLVDRFGANIMILTGAAALFIGEFLPGVSANPMAFAIGYVIFLSWADQVVYVGAFSNLASAFPDRRGLTMSLAAIGLSLGEIAIPPICQHLISSNGLATQFIVMGIILAGICLVGLYLCPTAPKGYLPAGFVEKDEAQEDTAEDETSSDFIQKDWKQMLKDPGFWIYFVLVILGGFTGIMLMSQCSWLAQDVIGVTPAQGAWLVSSLAIAALIGRVFWGYLGDRIGRLNLQIIMFIVMGVAMAGIALSGEGKAMLFIGSMLIGVFTSGGISSSTPAVVSDMFGTKNFALNFSIVMCALPIGQAAIPWIANIAVSGSYTTAFFIEVLASLVGVILSIILKKMKTGKLDIK